MVILCDVGQWVRLIGGLEGTWNCGVLGKIAQPTQVTMFPAFTTRKTVLYSILSGEIAGRCVL
jgi:hypothetical protein